MSFQDEGERIQAEQQSVRPVGSLEPSHGDVTAEEKQWGMLCHISALAGLAIGGLFFLGPLICWLIKKDTSRFVDYHGKESLNFQINILILALICTCTIIAIPLLPIVIVVAVIMPIIAGLKAQNGELYEYQYIFRLIK